MLDFNSSSLVSQFNENSELWGSHLVHPAVSSKRRLYARGDSSARSDSEEKKTDTDSQATDEVSSTASLPWQSEPSEPSEDVVVAAPIRKRIPLPKPKVVTVPKQGRIPLPCQLSVFFDKGVNFSTTEVDGKATLTAVKVEK
eukprot:TRINITY_DN4890_c6_g1_i1.p1 TRINITY_DN4890_c6_g1~~TRINITY_DN4890_c6_g1_i1.p1  ORF type:complete len:157 (+),score=37.27 TRINITY_DN4890_c6_g1_i1:47-472(+)